jgi:hypothetical protein
MFLGNHLDRSASDPIGRLLTEVVNEAAEHLSVLPEHEVEAVVASLPEIYQGYVSYRTSTLKRADLLTRVALYHLIGRVEGDYVSVREVLAQGLDSSVVVTEYPELESAFDADGLLCLDERFQLHDGGIQYRDHILHYHQFLRRGYFSNPNFDFLSRFARARRMAAAETTFRIAIDHDRLMRVADYVEVIERDRWFGPAFDKDRLDDPNTVGLTIVKRNQNSLFRLTNNLDRTEFYWSYRSGIKSLEIEEILSLANPIDDYYLNRYVHSERDTANGVFRHLDGAVKVYPKSEYQRRFDTKLPHEPRSSAKVKLFRIDGTMSLETWLELIAHFFKSNEMVLEYFDPEQFVQIFDERVRDFVAWKAKHGIQ